MLAILTQQACSAAVMVCPGVTQARSGCPNRTRTMATAAIWVARFIVAKDLCLYILHSNDVGRTLFSL
jgi:hypothetical protein